MHTRKHPRTMQEAFGPYASRDLEPLSRYKDPRIVRATLKLAIGATIFLIAAWVVVSILFSFPG